MKKIVLKLDLHDDKDKQKAMRAVSRLQGIDSIAMDMKEMKLSVVGAVDPVDIVNKLRKYWHTEIFSVRPAKEPEKEKEEPKKEVVQKKEAESKKDGEKKKDPREQQVVKSPKLDYSHFISLPLAIYPELAEKLQKFQNNVIGSRSGFDGNSDKVAAELKVQGEKEHLAVKVDTKTKASGSSDLGIEKSIFIKPKTFHLTVLMLKLWNKDLVARAAEVLQKISSKVNDALDNRPVSVKLEGLECMRGSPAKARVLYAPVKEIGAEGRLLRACQVIREAYVEAGLVLEKDARQALKLHATVMNERYRKWSKGSKKRDSFDARWILRRYGSEDWGDYFIREAHLSRRLSYDESGYYHCCASIPFPESMDT